jgi:hypothetical protein
LKSDQQSPNQLIQDDPIDVDPSRPLTLVAYECCLTTRAYIELVAVGEPLPVMPLFLEPDGCVMVPMEATYTAAFAVMPRRWAAVLEPPGPQ